MGTITQIVNISSINDQIPVAGLSSYAVSKAAISGLTRAIALELAPYGINVNTIRPAAIDTPMMKEVLELPDLAQSILRQIPRGRIGHPTDVAKTVLFLVSDLAEWITGAEIPVTGGMHLVGETSYNYYFEREMMHEENLPDVIDIDPIHTRKPRDYLRLALKPIILKLSLHLVFFGVIREIIYHAFCLADDLHKTGNIIDGSRSSVDTAQSMPNLFKKYHF